MFNLFKQKKTNTIEVILHCPDGLCEYAGFEIPKETHDFIKYVNAFIDDKEYNIELSNTPLAIQMGLL